jgi:hypothetical protein
MAHAMNKIQRKRTRMSLQAVDVVAHPEVMVQHRIELVVDADRFTGLQGNMKHL